MRKICVITGTRAEYGILSSLIRKINDDHDFQLQLIVTNMHLSPEFGLTYKEIEKDGFVINKKVEMMLSSDSSNAIAKSIGLATIGFADAYEDLRPDIILVLGDRYEILAAVSAALIYKIPVAHLHGGEVTEGVYDDAIRHSITKMSHLHFTSTEAYKNRVIQLGEDPKRVFNVGALGVENSNNLSLLTKAELEKTLNFSLGDKYFLVTFHPVTIENNSAEKQFSYLLAVLQEYRDYKIIFTHPNSDSGGRIIIKLMEEFVGRNNLQYALYQSLGKLRYLSAMKYSSAVIGNSSSGIIEAPGFGIPTLNIGDRQKGRIAANSVINCVPTLNGIREGIKTILSDAFVATSRNVQNPYQKTGTGNEIIKILKSFPLGNLVVKSFYDLKI